jgi:6-phosphofructokinase 1
VKQDASGNVLHEDIVAFLRDRIKEHFTARNIPINLKYLDPSYLIRSVSANAWDRVLSDRMARNAVHAAMAGKTDLMIGFVHGTSVHVPIRTAIAQNKQMDVSSDVWNAVLSTTGQPHW